MLFQKYLLGFDMKQIKLFKIMRWDGITILQIQTTIKHSQSSYLIQIKYNAKILIDWIHT